MHDRLFDDWFDKSWLSFKGPGWDEGIDKEQIAREAWNGAIETILKRLPTEAPSLHALRNLVEEIESEDGIATEDWPALENAKEVLAAHPLTAEGPGAEGDRNKPQQEGTK